MLASLAGNWSAALVVASMFFALSKMSLVLFSVGLFLHSVSTFLGLETYFLITVHLQQHHFAIILPFIMSSLQACINFSLPSS